MSNPVEEYQRVKAVKETYQEMLMAKANVIGVGIGYAHRNLRMTNQLALVVMVDKKLPAEELDPEDMIPSELDGIPVDVQQTGEISAHN